MYNPIKNLGDYNKIRIDLEKCGGNKEKLYKEIGDSAVAQNAPKYLLIGAGIVLGAEAIIMLGKKAVESYKDRKYLLKLEPQVKQEFIKVVEQFDTDKEEGVDVDE